MKYYSSYNFFYEYQPFKNVKVHTGHTETGRRLDLAHKSWFDDPWGSLKTKVLKH